MKYESVKRIVTEDIVEKDFNEMKVIINYF